MSQKTSLLQGNKKDLYLNNIHSALAALESKLSQSNENESVREFGEANKWQMERLVQGKSPQSVLSSLVGKIRQNYAWLGSRNELHEPEQNSRWFDEVQIDSESGLPWVFDFVELHRLKRESRTLLRQYATEKEYLHELVRLLMGDETRAEDVPQKARDLQEFCRKRNFLERIRDAPLLSWELGKLSEAPCATLIANAGIEQLWRITAIHHHATNGMFEGIVADAWQDSEGTDIKRNDSSSTVSDRLQQALMFAEQNPAWYVLQQIDLLFPKIHPVHISRGILGPCESKYLTNPTKERGLLPTTPEIISCDSDALFLRFKRQYSYAPNRLDEAGKMPVQIVHQQDWHDEYIMSPAAYVSSVAQRILGAKVHVIEYRCSHE